MKAIIPKIAVLHYYYLDVVLWVYSDANDALLSVR